MNLNPKISELVLRELKKEILECDNKEYLYKIITTVEIIAAKFPQIHQNILHFITGKVFRYSVFYS